MEALQKKGTLSMSAKTRHKKIEETVGVLTLLFLTVIDIIHKGKRSERMIDQFRLALQLMKENRLGVVLAGRASDGVPPNIQDLLSLPLNSVGLSGRTKSQLAGRYFNPRYVGDLLMPRAKRMYVLPGYHFSGELRSMLGELGIPLDLSLENIDGAGTEWNPPYANDPETLAKWAQPQHEVLGWKRCRGCTSYGEFLRSYMARSSVYVPKSWKAPEIPEEICFNFGESSN